MWRCYRAEPRFPAHSHTAACPEKTGILGTQWSLPIGNPVRTARLAYPAPRRSRFGAANADHRRNRSALGGISTEPAHSHDNNRAEQGEKAGPEESGVGIRQSVDLVEGDGFALAV